MEWTRTDTLATALNICTTCHGLGLITGKRGRDSPCNCVLRRIFRECYNRFCHCATKEKHMSKVSLQVLPGSRRRLAWGRKDEEYVADFYLVSRRHLNGDEFRLFTWHYLLGADWKLCCRKLGMDRGNFFHACYRIQQRLGRVFRELQPYGLYPLEEYFHGSTHQRVEPCRPGEQLLRLRTPGGRGPVVPPLRKVA